MVVGLAVGLHELDGFRKVVGFQVQLVNATVLLTLSCTDCPAQIEGLEGVMLTTGVGFTVTVTVVLAVHEPVVPVTVYVVVAAGLTTTVLPLRFPGCHT